MYEYRPSSGYSFAGEVNTGFWIDARCGLVGRLKKHILGSISLIIGHSIISIINDI